MRSGNLHPNYHGYTRRNVVFLPFEDTLGDEHGKICILHAEFLDMSIAL
jgi:hypothetical protein